MNHPPEKKKIRDYEPVPQRRLLRRWPSLRSPAVIGSAASFAGAREQAAGNRKAPNPSPAIARHPSIFRRGNTTAR